MSKLNISEREAGNITILDMEGDITFGEGNVELRWTIRRLIGEGRKDILLNFSEVRYVDSSGIGELISAMTAVSREHGQLKLLNVTPRLYELLSITRLLKVFELFEDERKALDSFR